LFLHHFSIFFKLQLSGLGLIIAGATVLADVGEFSHFIEAKVFAPPIVLIVAGVLVFLIASLGCYGAFRESPPLLNAVSKTR
jgi:CD63 antigen